MYADDTTLNSTLKSFGDVTNIKRLQHNISMELNNVVRWLDLNKLRLNVFENEIYVISYAEKGYPSSIFHNIRQCD